MKRLFTTAVLATGILSSLMASPTHLDIMVPDIKDTDLHGPVKSVELKVWQNVSGEYTTEKREYDETGNLLKITENDEEGTLVETRSFKYDENGCYDRMSYHNKEEDKAYEWKVVLNPETRQIALQEIKTGRIGLETYSPEGYIVSYKLVDKDHKPILTYKYKRDENNRKTKFTRIEGRKPAYTYYYKWADNGFIDMERQHYHQEKAERLHSYEYLVTDDHCNWTQRIMVRYDIGGGKKEKVYERTVQRKIEYFEDAAGAGEEQAGGDTKVEEDAATDTEAADANAEDSEEGKDDD